MNQSKRRYFGKYNDKRQPTQDDIRSRSMKTKVSSEEKYATYTPRSEEILYEWSVELGLLNEVPEVRIIRNRLRKDGIEF